MTATRREFVVGAVEAISGVGLVMCVPTRAHACLWGTWRLKCPICGRVDMVEDGTCQHKCSNDKTHQFFAGNVVTIMCPSNHENRVDTGELMKTLKCRAERCGRECRLDPEVGAPPKRDQPDRGGR